MRIPFFKQKRGIIVAGKTICPLKNNGKPHAPGSPSFFSGKKPTIVL
jgi:hypothetical protein